MLLLRLLGCCYRRQDCLLLELVLVLVRWQRMELVQWMLVLLLLQLVRWMVSLLPRLWEVSMWMVRCAVRPASLVAWWNVRVLPLLQVG